MVLAEVGVSEDEAGGGRVLDSRPDKLLDRELWASCRGLDACPEFLLPPRAEIFPEVLQSPKLSLFQLEGKTFLALSKSSEFDFVEDKFIRFVRTSEEERVWVSEGAADVLVEVCEGLKEIFESSVFLELVSVCLFAGSLSMAGVVVERGLDDLRVSELTVRARDGNAPPEVLKFGPSAVLPFVEHAGGVHCLVVTDPEEEGLVEKPTLLGSGLVVDFENVGKDFEDGEVEEEGREEKEEEEDESEESTSSSSTTSPSSPLWCITVRFFFKIKSQGSL